MTKIKSLALAAVTLIGATAAHAAAVDGDLILGVTDVNGTNNLTIDLGYITSFTTASGTLNLGNYGTYFTQAFGANWNTRTDLSFGLLAGKSGGTQAASALPGFAGWTAWVSKAASAPGNSGTDFENIIASKNPLSSSRGVSQRMLNLYGNINSDYAFAPEAGATNVSIQLNGEYASGTSWFDALNNTSSTVAGDVFGVNGGGLGAALPLVQFAQTDVNGNLMAFDQTITGANNYVELRQMTYGSAATSYVGSLNLTSAGDISFAGVSAIPEPSTYGLMGAGAAAAAAFVRRRKKMAV